MVKNPDRRLRAAKPQRRRDMSGFSPRDLHPSSGNIDIDDVVDSYEPLTETVVDLTDPRSDLEPALDRTSGRAHVVDVRLILSDGREVL